jgi:excisionase family DNA binding protein
MIQESTKTVLTPVEVSKILGICLRKTYEMLRANEIPNRKAGDKFLISAERLDKWINETSHPNN